MINILAGCLWITRGFRGHRLSPLEMLRAKRHQVTSQDGWGMWRPGPNPGRHIGRYAARLLSSAYVPRPGERAPGTPQPAETWCLGGQADGGMTWAGRNVCRRQ
ncbi:hypothetical protein GCM10022225_05770 [Plantactinospora mayteni]|uniref:Transposase n=1 Tax=Plantactinospora mayteni TaxID=566021 RepID=A0ABQ4EQX5_9ACTN|nr:hypothetical protein Pma05_36390 [Plantactinospora mayteni]